QIVPNAGADDIEVAVIGRIGCGTNLAKCGEQDQERECAAAEHVRTPVAKLVLDCQLSLFFSCLDHLSTRQGRCKLEQKETNDGTSSHFVQQLVTPLCATEYRRAN